MIYTTDILLAIARELEPEIVKRGGHVAIGGSCVYRGYSTKDMDMMFYPHKKEAPLDRGEVVSLLHNLGWTEVRSSTPKYATCIPDVLVMQKGELRVDFFILNR